MNFAKYRVISFDCYGTLIDWETGIIRALTPVFERHNVRIDRESLLSAYATAESEIEAGSFLKYSDVLREVVRRLGRGFGFVPDAADEERLPKSVAQWPPFPDTVEAIRRLKKRFQLAIISNVDNELFRGTSQALSVSFDWVVTAEQVGAYKPSFRVFEHAYRQIGIPRENILHVAQSLYHDIAPAKSLGQTCVWVNRRKGQVGTGATPRSDAVPDLEVTTLAQLATLVDNS